MAKELSIVLRLKNELQVGLAKAESTLGSFGSSVASMGTAIASGVAAAGAVIVGFAAKALAAFAESEAAVTSLKTSFRAYGEEVDVNVQKIAQYVNAIKEETGVSGTALTARAAKLKMLGVETSQLGEALKATVALASAGMDEEAATRAVAQAMEGNFTALQKYIPAVRAAGTEQEKMAAVNDFLTRGYAVQKDQLNTLAGQWGLLKERVGDAWENIGAAIANNGTIQASLTAVSEKARDFGDAINEWVTSGGIENFNAVFMATMENIRYGFEMAGVNANIFWRTLSEDRFIKYISDALGSFIALAAEELNYLGQLWQAVSDKIRNPFTNAFKMPDSGPGLAAASVFFDTLAGKYQGDYSKWNEALAAKEAAQATHIARLYKISQQQLAGLDAVNVKKVKSDATASAASQQIAAAAGLKIVANAQKTEDAIELISQNREGNEQSVADAIVSIHDGAAAQVEDRWGKSVDSLLEKQAAAVSAFQNLSPQVQTNNAPTGGSFSTGTGGNASTGNRLYSRNAVTSTMAGGRVVPVYHNFDSRSNDAMTQVADNTRIIAENIKQTLSWG